MSTSEKQTHITEFAAKFPQLFEQLGADNLQILMQATSVIELSEGRKLIRDKMPTDAIYFLLDGSMTAYVEEGGVAVALSEVKPGQWLGEISILSGELLASATVEANTSCKLVKMHHKAFEKLIAENHEIAKVLLENFIALMLARMRGTTARV